MRLKSWKMQNSNEEGDGSRRAYMLIAGVQGWKGKGWTGRNIGRNSEAKLPRIKGR